MANELLASWLQHELDVAAIYRLLGYEITHNVEVDGWQIDLLCEGWQPGAQRITLVVDCKQTDDITNKSVSKDDVVLFIANFNAHKELNGWTTGVIVSNQPFTKNARAAALRHHDIVLKTVHELYEDVFHIRPYLQNAIREYERTNLFSDYVPLFGRTQEQELANIPSEVPIQDIVDAWITSPDSAQMSVLGDFGSGKTTFLKYVHYQCAQAYLSGSLSRLPILLLLNNYSACADTTEFVSRILREELGVTVPQYAFFEFVRAGKFLLLMDGFDEMTRASDAIGRRLSYLRLAPLAEGESKLLISCRPAYFVSQVELREVFGQLNDQIGFAPAKSKGDKKATESYVDLTVELQERAGRNDLPETLRTVTSRFAGAMLVYLQLLSESQVKTYLHNYRQQIHQLSAGYYSPDTLWDLMVEVYDLEDLSRRPILLKLIVETLPLFVRRADGRYEVQLRGERETFSAITPSRLYFFYTEQELIRAAERRSATTVLDRNAKRGFIQALAFRLFEKNVSALDLAEFVRAVKDWLQPPDAELHAIAAEIHSCSFMVRDRVDRFVFTHKSFMEYFAAAYLLQLLAAPPKAKQLLTTIKLSEEVLYFLGDLVASIGPGYIAVLRNFEVSGDRTLQYNSANTLIFSRNARTQVSKWDIDGLIYIKQNLPRLELESCKIGYVKLKRSKIREMRLAKTTVQNFEVIGPGISTLTFGDGACTTMSLVAVDGMQLNFDDVDIRAFVCAGSRIKSCIFRNCLLSASDFKGTVIETARFEKCVLTCQSEAGFSEVEDFQNVIFDGCAFVDFNLDGAWKRGCRFVSCTFIRCVLSDMGNATLFKGCRGFLLRNSSTQPRQRSVYEPPVVSPGHPSIYSFEQAMKPVRFPDTISSFEELVLQVFPADHERIKHIDLKSIDQKFLAAKSNWAKIRKERGHRASDDFVWRTDDDLEGAIRKATKDLGRTDPFEGPGKFIRLAQLRSARAWKGELNARFVDWESARSLCNSVLEANPAHHNACCLKAGVAVDMASRIERTEHRFKLELENAFRDVSTAIRTLSSCGFAHVLYCDLAVLTEGIPFDLNETASHVSAAVGEGSLSNSALVDWAEVLRQRALASTGHEQIALGRRSLLRLALCLRRERNDSLANASLKTLALSLGEIRIRGDLGLPIRKASPMPRRESEHGIVDE